MHKIETHLRYKWE